MKDRLRSFVQVERVTASIDVIIMRSALIATVFTILLGARTITLDFLGSSLWVSFLALWGAAALSDFVLNAILHRLFMEAFLLKEFDEDRKLPAPQRLKLQIASSFTRMVSQYAGDLVAGMSHEERDRLSGLMGRIRNRLLGGPIE